MCIIANFENKLLCKYQPVHDSQHLFADVLCPFQRADLNKVLEAPGTGELVVLPGVVHGQQRHVVTLDLVKLGFLLVRQGLLVLEKFRAKIKYNVMVNTTFLMILILFLDQTIWRDHILETSLRDDSNEWSHHTVWFINKNVRHF